MADLLEHKVRDRRQLLAFIASSRLHRNSHTCVAERVTFNNSPVTFSASIEVSHSDLQHISSCGTAMGVPAELCNLERSPYR